MKSPIERRHQKDKRSIPLRGEGNQEPDRYEAPVSKVKELIEQIEWSREATSKPDPHSLLLALVVGLQGLIED